MNWKYKSALLKIFSVVPASVYNRATIDLLRSGGISLATGIPEVWEFHRNGLQKYGASRVIEFGAGKHLGQNIWLSKYIPTQHVVDITDMADLGLVNDVMLQLVEIGELDSQPEIKHLEELNERFGISYLAPLDLLELPENEAKYDANITSSTWEHIPSELIQPLLEKLCKLIRPGGLISAHIDYSDHYSHSDTNIDRVNFLSLSDAEWRRHNHRHFFQNRLRHQDFYQIFDAAGLDLQLCEASNFVANPLHMPLPENLTGTKTDLATTGRWHLITAQN